MQGQNTWFYVQRDYPSFVQIAIYYILKKYCASYYPFLEGYFDVFQER